MSVPLTVVEDLLRDIMPRLVNPFASLDEAELRAMLRQLRGAQKDAPAEKRGQLFSAIGQVLFYLREFDGALDAFKNAANYEKHNAIRWNNLACCYLELGRAGDAMDAIKKARAQLAATGEERIVILCTLAEALYRTGEATGSRAAFDEVFGLVDRTKGSDLFHLANAAAGLGRDADAAELLAQAIAAEERTDLGAAPAVEYLRARQAQVSSAKLRSRTLAQALERAYAAYDEPMPAAHEIRSRIELSPEAGAAFDELLDNPPAPTEGLRRLIDESRA